MDQQVASTPSTMKNFSRRHTERKVFLRYTMAKTATTTMPTMQVTQAAASRNR